MCDSFVGCVVSVDCGEVLGTYQGRVTSIDADSQSVTLTKTFRNGVVYNVPKITISASDIHDLKIISSCNAADKLPPGRLHHLSGPQSFNGEGVSTAAGLEELPKRSGGRRKGGSPTSAAGEGVARNTAVKGQRQSPNVWQTECVAARSHSPLTKATQNNNHSSLYHSNDNHPHHPSDCAQHYSAQPGSIDCGNHCETSAGSRLTVAPTSASSTTVAGSAVTNGYGRNGHTPSKPGRHQGARSGASPRSHQSQTQHRVTPNAMEEQNGRNRTGSFSDTRGVKSMTSTPRKIEGRKKPAKEDCFSAPVETYLNEEFDFEKNLALFDKRAVFNEIDNSGVCGKAAPQRGSQPPREAKYKCDENVLQSKPAAYKQIKVPAATSAATAGREYVTDSGLVVPAVSYELRQRLLEAARDLGLSVDRQVEVVGRSASEMVLQLIGGAHRLNPQNAHQSPSVVVLCGPHVQGAEGVNCARHLAMHNVRVTVYLAESEDELPDVLQTELRLYKLTGGVRVAGVQELPGGPVDMIVNTMDNAESSHMALRPWYRPLVEWTNTSQASVLAVDPPPEGSAIAMKWSLGKALPLALGDRCGQVYLCDLSVPREVYRRVGITYRSPFAHKFVIPLHSS